MKRNQQARVFSGVHWGDEAKGATTVRYARHNKVNIIVRDGGANNCGHEDLRSGVLLKAHSIPVAGTLPGRTAVVGGTSLIMPRSYDSLLIPGRFRKGLIEEHTELVAAGCRDFKLVLDGRLNLILPPDMAMELVAESGPFKRGTTGSGVSMARARQALTCGIRLIDCFDPIALNEALARADWYRQNVLQGTTLAYASYRDDLLRLAEWVTETHQVRLEDADRFLQTSWTEGESIYYEMPQSHGLCMLRGSVPFTTASFPTQPAGIWYPSGIRSIPVFKAGYVTRVGMGPFLTRHSAEQEAAMRKAGGEFGVSTGRDRDTGDWDAVHTRSALDSALGDGLIEVAATKLDVLRGTHPRACTAYVNTRTGEIVDRWPNNPARLGDYIPDPAAWVKLPWFTEDVTDARTWDDLPQGAQELILATETLISTPERPVRIGSVSVGQESSAVIWRDATA